MKPQYTDEELKKLHEVLFEILGEIIRVCEALDIEYFIQGGTAIGAHFWNDILPWDDDIDIGMTRNNYNRFLKEAPALLAPEYFLAWYGTDTHSPFYFAKLRKNNTTFLEESCKNVDMHHGIYVDVFPYDKVPNNKFLQHLHRKLCNRINECFAGKDVWPWAYCGKCDIEKPNRKGFWGCLFTRVVVSLVPKAFLYRLLCWVQGWFNNSDADYYNLVMTSVDHIPVADIKHPQKMKLGPLMVTAPSNLESYLHHHYGKNIQRTLPKEQQINHAPLVLEFSVGANKVS